MMADHSEAARRLAPLVLGLMDEEPNCRWDLERVQAFLDAQEPVPSTLRGGEPERDGPRLLEADQQRLIEDRVAHLLASMNPNQDWLWPSTCFGSTTDACNIHHGAAGVVAVLTQVALAHRDQRLNDGLRTACAWIERRLPAEPRLLPGLHFGRSGTAWALYDAARLLDDEPMAERALALAKRVPSTRPNPDVTHGVAGAGLAQLYLWQATGLPAFRERVERCADSLLSTVEYQETAAVWPVPTSFDSKFTGGTFYGFAHGVAGIAWFLLAAGLTTGRDDCLALARSGGETLCAAARRGGDGVTWREGPGDEVTQMVHWCHGSSGVGTFLIRLWQATGDERYRELAAMAVVAVRRGRWQASPCVCHGLAGNGEFLLDMAAALDERTTGHGPRSPPRSSLRTVPTTMASAWPGWSRFSCGCATTIRGCGWPIPPQSGQPSADRHGHRGWRGGLGRRPRQSRAGRGQLLVLGAWRESCLFRQRRRRQPAARGLVVRVPVTPLVAAPASPAPHRPRSAAPPRRRPHPALPQRCRGP
ncbi:MAG: lanthionine synthetase LanC family protein [Egibacteraceae bacterium]